MSWARYEKAAEQQTESKFPAIHIGGNAKVQLGDQVSYNGPAISKAFQKATNDLATGGGIGSYVDAGVTLMRTVGLISECLSLPSSTDKEDHEYVERLLVVSASNGLSTLASALVDDYGRVSDAPSLLAGGKIGKLLLMTLEAVQDLRRIVQHVLESELYSDCKSLGHVFEKACNDPENQRGLDLITNLANNAILWLTVVLKYVY